MVRIPLQIAFIALHYWLLVGDAPSDAGELAKL